VQPCPGEAQDSAVAVFSLGLYSCPQLVHLICQRPYASHNRGTEGLNLLFLAFTFAPARHPRRLLLISSEIVRLDPGRDGVLESANNWSHE